MSANVKKRRTYRSPLRENQAEKTRAAVLEAARKLFVGRGWSGTTIEAIASGAGVSKETVYASFGSKREILRLLIANAIRGADPATPLLEQRGPQSVLEETDQRQQISRFAADIATVLARVAPLIGVVRSASENNVEMADMYRELQRGRRKNLSFVADALLARGPLRQGLGREAATTVIWRLASPELFLLMRNVEGRSIEHYRAWLDETLSALLLPER